MKRFYAFLFLGLLPALLAVGGLSEPKAAARANAVIAKRMGTAAAASPWTPAMEAAAPAPDPAGETDFPPAYVGSPSCRDCHLEIYERFVRGSKKARTREQVEKMLPKLTGEEQQTCFQCHATGYGQPGGFISYFQTPDLGDVGCEACHGPGSAHLQSQSQWQMQDDPPAETIRRRPDPQTCASCHTPERGGGPDAVRMFSGAH
ncbi:MAG: cytochrome c family protein [Deltaproteobacteria bacterium]|nr:cytochrome c family protein [Deltaproteobacteria bacterium]